MIDLKKELQNYPPIDIEKLLANTPDLPDNLKNSMQLYNKALEGFKTKSEDIAVIELRKSISLNPDFHEAINLLGVYYASTGQNDKAKEVFERVISAERNSVIALDYLKSVDPGFKTSTSKLSKVKVEKEEPKNTELKRKRQESPNPGTGSIFGAGINRKKNETGKYVACFIAGALLVFLFSIKFYWSPEAKDVNSDIDVVVDSTPEVKEDFEAKYNQLEKNYKDLEEKYTNAVKESDYYKKVTNLLEVEKTVNNKNYQTAADQLLLMKNFQFSGIEKEKYEFLVGETMVKAATALYNEGRVLYNQKKYVEAVEKFARAHTYSDNWTYASANLYYAGNCYKQINNYTKALITFNEVVEKYPSTSYARYSKNRINEVNRLQEATNGQE